MKLLLWIFQRGCSMVWVRVACIHPVESITAKDVAQAARLADLISQQFLADASRYLGIAVANLVNLINPGVVIVGREVRTRAICCLNQFVKPCGNAV